MKLDQAVPLVLGGALLVTGTAFVCRLLWSTPGYVPKREACGESVQLQVGAFTEKSCGPGQRVEIRKVRQNNSGYLAVLCRCPGLPPEPDAGAKDASVE